MSQITDFFKNLFTTDSWPARWQDVTWTNFDGWLYIISNLTIWAAFFVISFFIIRYLRKKSDAPLPLVFWLFSAFILFCGLTYLIDVIIFWWPNYRLSALVRLITAIISWVTVVAIFKYFPLAISLKSTNEFEKELTERKKSEIQFKGLLESAPDAMVITDGTGTILMVNAQTQTIFGYERFEIIGKKVELLIPDRFQNHHVHHRQKYVESPKVRAMGAGMELFGRRKDASEFPVEVSLSPMQIEGGEFMIISAIRDITKQKATEAEIKQINENLEKLVSDRTKKLEDALLNEQTIRLEMIQDQKRLRLLTEISEIFVSSPDINKTLEIISNRLVSEIADWCTIDSVEKDGTFTCLAVSHRDPAKVPELYELKTKYHSSPSFLKGLDEIIKTQKISLLSEISEDFISEYIKDQQPINLINSLNLRSVIIIPLLVQTKLFGIITLVLSTSDKSYSEKGLEFAQDLSRRATLAIENAILYQELHNVNSELEQRVAKRTLELEAINKELEAFSYSVSHDLRAPLRSIDGFSNKLLKDYGSQFDVQAKDYFSRIMNASRKMGILIDDLLKLARLSRVEMKIETTNMSDLGATIISDLKETNPGREVEFNIQEGMKTMADKNLIQIALQNLLGNAWKYSKNKVHTKIEFGSLESDKQIYFIRDNGVGFDMKYVDKLFGAFQRLHNISEFEGTGIGLATVQRIIRRHHGNIWAESEINKGTTFFFTLNQ